VTQGYGIPTRVIPLQTSCSAVVREQRSPGRAAAAVRTIRVYRWRTARPSSGTMRA